MANEPRGTKSHLDVPDPESGINPQRKLPDQEKEQLAREDRYGKGMTSPDSTEAVLSAETGNPDPRATGKQGGQSGQSGQSGGQSGRSASSGQSGNENPLRGDESYRTNTISPDRST
ncbi:MAG TPA: hypothetical protein VJU80_03645 [Solirubrobacteraceae bacterium]|nr:hypothetical protein [Solirubrobacteraceae bacterium]